MGGPCQTVDSEGLGESLMRNCMRKSTNIQKESLQHLVEAGATPDFIQPGNEISYGILWGKTPIRVFTQKTFIGKSANWDRFGKLLRQAIKACREVCPAAKIVIHTERVAQHAVLASFYDKMKSLGVGVRISSAWLLSILPWQHGCTPEKALAELEKKFAGKEIMVVETGYPYKWEVPGTTHDVTKDYPYTEAGQDKYVADLVKTLHEYPDVDGLFWWWLEYNAYGAGLSNWYNAPSSTARQESDPQLSPLSALL